MGLLFDSRQIAAKHHDGHCDRGSKEGINQSLAPPYTLHAPLLFLQSRLNQSIYRGRGFSGNFRQLFVVIDLLAQAF